MQIQHKHIHYNMYKCWEGIWGQGYNISCCKTKITTCLLIPASSEMCLRLNLGKYLETFPLASYATASMMYYIFTWNGEIIMIKLNQPEWDVS